jgi:hypothetical protein
MAYQSLRINHRNSKEKQVVASCAPRAAALWEKGQLVRGSFWRVPEVRAAQSCACSGIGKLKHGGLSPASGRCSYKAFVSVSKP